MRGRLTGGMGPGTLGDWHDWSLHWRRSRHDWSLHSLHNWSLNNRSRGGRHNGSPGRGQSSYDTTHYKFIEGTIEETLVVGIDFDYWL